MKQLRQIIRSPAPHPMGTAIILAALFMAWIFEPDSSPYALASHTARWLAGGLLAAALFELATLKLWNLVRTDWVCLGILYSLSYLEFLFAQPDLDRLATMEDTRAACGLFNLGFIGLALGRHLIPARVLRPEVEGQNELSLRLLIRAYWAAFFLGFFYVFVAVRFNPLDAIDAMMGPRFSQPWGRGRLGDWKALLVELGLLTYLIPPIFGHLLAHRKNMRLATLLALSIPFAFTLFFGFTSGTRNIFGVYIITFLIGYLTGVERLSIRRIALVSALSLGLAGVASYHMLEFRNMGLKRYLERGPDETDTTRDTLFVDFNLYYLGLVARALPERHDFLGSEVLIWSLVKPIPRALWAGKPEGLSVSIEEAVGAEQMSVATTWVGESYMAYGKGGVLFTGLIFGAIAAFWNRRGSRHSSRINKIIYASGFFAAALTMRSSFWFTTAILPTLALVLGVALWRYLKRRSPRKRSVQTAAEPQPSLRQKRL